MNESQLLALHDLQYAENKNGIKVTRVSWPDWLVGEEKKIKWLAILAHI